MTEAERRKLNGHYLSLNGIEANLRATKPVEPLPLTLRSAMPSRERSNGLKQIFRASIFPPG
jgi:hypothetical protein